MCDKSGTRTKSVATADVAKHVGHGCTVGACATPDAAPGGTTGTGGGTPIVIAPDVTDPATTPPDAEAGSLSDRFQATASYPMYAASSNQPVKVCRPDGFSGGKPSGSWNELVIAFKDVEAFLIANPYAIYGTCSDNAAWIARWLGG